jgi:diguanylate cyclase (GGDEF)-like protein
MSYDSLPHTDALPVENSVPAPLFAPTPPAPPHPSHLSPLAPRVKVGPSTVAIPRPSEFYDLRALRDLGTDLVDVLGMDRDWVAPEVGRHAAELRDARSESLYSDLLFTLTHLRFPEEVAEAKWRRVLEHKYVMSQRQGRNVGMRVALLDYLLNVTRELQNVTFLEVDQLEETRRESIFDWLTGVYLKGHFLSVSETEISRARRRGQSCSFFFFDIDHFKVYNDRFGHLAGDALLKLVPWYVQDMIRSYDLIGRYGGEEFVILFPDTTLRDALRRADEIRSLLSEMPFLGREEMPGGTVTISGGVAAFPHHGADMKSILGSADAALYRAKKAGRNRVMSLPPQLRLVEPGDEASEP